MSQTNLTTTIPEIRKAIEKNQRFFISAHEHPDGDAVGATLALGLALLGAGKSVVMYNADTLPKNAQFLPGGDKLVTEFPEDEAFDVVFILDSGELSRIGPVADKIKDHPMLINVDHHKTNDHFGKINLVAETASSTGELIYKILAGAQIPLNKDIALNLYTAIYTDTGAFRHSSATPDSYSICGELVKLGVSPTLVSEEYYMTSEEPKLRLLGRALSSLVVEPGGQIAGVTLTDKDLTETGAGLDEVEGFVEYPRSIRSVKVAYFLREEGGRVKGSLRSGPEADVAVVAESFGGGGHARAAGFKKDGTLEQVRKEVVEKLKNALS